MTEDIIAMVETLDRGSCAAAANLVGRPRGREWQCHHRRYVGECGSLLAYTSLL